MEEKENSLHATRMIEIVLTEAGETMKAPKSDGIIIIHTSCSIELGISLVDVTDIMF